MASVKITERHGKYVRIEQAHFDEFLRRLKMGELTESSGGSCESFCDDACEDDGGCDLEFGSPGDCGALCNSGEIYLEL